MALFNGGPCRFGRILIQLLWHAKKGNGSRETNGRTRRVAYITGCLTMAKALNTAVWCSWIILELGI